MADKKQLKDDDPRTEEVLTELHAAVVAKYKIDPDTGNKIPCEDSKDPLGYAYSLRDRIAAGKAFLDFTMQKPSSKHDVNVSKPEEWLAALAEEEEADGPETEEGSASSSE